ncbi:polyketide synthase dehydratase domain-containing protein, partial [Streptomyces sp. NPDC102437]|uniref:polyketide synthase dehydratase domain-containing protein n=1 Tax=Streptomyces sp. NPDC102437 TaxID=3366175 RepID=UPI003809791F
WTTYYNHPKTHHTPLPTYPFQHHTYWLKSADVSLVDVSSAGLTSSNHPLLGAAVGLADDDRSLLTGRLSLDSHPWLADHTVMGNVLLPGTAFAELALHAGQQAGLPHLAELTLAAPLVLAEDSVMRLQVLLGAADGTDGRQVTVFSRQEDAAADAPWTKHAEGLLTRSVPESSGDLSQWPPAGAMRIDIESFYEAASRGKGLHYGPVFQGLQGAWKRDGDIFAEIALPDEQHADAERFSLHPALMDSALHAVGLGAFLAEADRPYVPFAWGDVSLHAVSARSLRVRICPEGDDEVSLLLADETGEPVLSAARLRFRPAPEDVVGPGLAQSVSRSLFQVTWKPLQVRQEQPSPARVSLIAPNSDVRAVLGDQAAEFDDLDALASSLASGGVPAPDVVVIAVPRTSSACGADAPEVAERALTDVLGLLQEWLSNEQFSTSHLVLVTRSAILLDEDAPVDSTAGLAHAAVWGLVRSAQAENPDRFTLLDLDDLTTEATPLQGTITGALAAGESQVAIRHGLAYTPRLTHTTAQPDHHTAPTPDW